MRYFEILYTSVGSTLCYASHANSELSNFLLGYFCKVVKVWIQKFIYQEMYKHVVSSIASIITLKDKNVIIYIINLTVEEHTVYVMRQ